MKRLSLFALGALLFAACTNSDKYLRERAAMLCRHIPDHELQEYVRLHNLNIRFYQDYAWEGVAL